jgi:alkanesulfonate monooxygenase SsuD/methylene tetrahydromethanopterin reductase-like flavin-dependent oxidoreductase (luciferase family)
VALKLGITAWTGRAGWRARELAEQAAWAEARGFDSLWLPENHFTDARAIPSPLTLLAAAAAGSTTIRLATTSYLLPIRNPILAAEEVAVLDQLSGGRLILGVGRGIGADLFDVFGLPVAEKRRVFEENLRVMLAALSGDPLGDDSDKPVGLAPLPLQRPHPPIWLAAIGPLALQQSGRLGLPYLASPLESLAVLADNYGAHRSALLEHGHAAVETVPVMRSVFVSADSALLARLTDALQSTVPARLRGKAGAVEDWAILGDREEVHDKLQEYQEVLGMTHLIARGQVSRLVADQQAESHDMLLAIAGRL